MITVCTLRNTCLLLLLLASGGRLLRPVEPIRGWNSYDAFGASNESVTLL